MRTKHTTVMSAKHRHAVYADLKRRAFHVFRMPVNRRELRTISTE